jgi:lysophospholipase L1-like esterase
LAVLGDSIAYGQGASVRQDTPGQRLAAALREAGHEVELRVVAVPGSVSADLERQVAAILRWDPDIAVVVIGANDLTHFVSPIEAAAHLERAVRALRSGGAEVVIAPAPDLSAVPHVPDALRGIVRTASATLRAEQVRVATAAGARVADIDAATSTRFARDPRLFAADRFHPSSAGYAVIAGALIPELLAAATAVRSTPHEG